MISGLTFACAYATLYIHLIETQPRKNSTRLGTLKRDVGWIKGTLEGSQEGSNKVLTVLTVCTAVGAAIIVLVDILT